MRHDHRLTRVSIAAHRASTLGLDPKGLNATLESYRRLQDRGLGRAGIQALIALHRS